jgi:streptogramin lyase
MTENIHPGPSLIYRRVGWVISPKRKNSEYFADPSRIGSPSARREPRGASVPLCFHASCPLIAWRVADRYDNKMSRNAIRSTLLALASILLVTSGCSRINSPVRASSAGPSVEFVGQWGAKGDAPGQLDDPVGIATDTLGNVYVTDAGSEYIHKFDPKGTPLLSFQEDPLKHPQAIAVDWEGVIYVTDPARASVFIFLPDDEKERHHELRLKTRASAENSLSIVVDDDGVIYVLDAKAGKVFVYSPRLRLERSWAPAGSSGAGRHWDALELGADRNLYFADLSTNHLLRFSAEGQLLAEVAPNADANANAGTSGQASATTKISNEFAVSHDYIFMMDSNGTTLHVWSVDGKPKLDVDLGPQLGPGYHAAPPIALSPRHELFVLDESKARVLRYRVNL